MKKLKCVICGKEFDQLSDYSIKLTCSEICRKKRFRQSMMKTYRDRPWFAKGISERMKKKNPMRKKETRLKVSATLKRIGHYPIIRGGNGQKMPLSQKILLTNQSFSALLFIINIPTIPAIIVITIAHIVPNINP